ncbi:MAG: J domain-containing protein [Armatimonadota bacterium]
MGIARRIRRIIKGYMKTARERLDDLEAELARRELEEHLQPGGAGGAKLPETAIPTPTDTSPVAPGQDRAPDTDHLPADVQTSFRLLGLPPGATLEQLETTYTQLMKRADPARFPEGSEERKRAEEIRHKIESAYRAVRDYMDSTYARMRRINL